MDHFNHSPTFALFGRGADGGLTPFFQTNQLALRPTKNSILLPQARKVDTTTNCAAQSDMRHSIGNGGGQR
ncbi:hypothetical protein M514_15749 [Trichuris suis]|uniref:Uncharacterized protein n=1 Tax=Trichuris suis TaxID=68888 RepID=A0A085NRF1_9BILA|nr:hypothetical protein M514_15749 [Trichuris suis]